MKNWTYYSFQSESVKNFGSLFTRRSHFLGVMRLLRRERGREGTSHVRGASIRTKRLGGGGEDEEDGKDEGDEGRERP